MFSHDVKKNMIISYTFQKVTEEKIVDIDSRMYQRTIDTKSNFICSHLNVSVIVS